MEFIKLIIIALLILLTAFFVASEFAIVKVRKSRIDQLVKERKKNASAAKEVISNLDGYLSAVQLGITITALGLGWLGEPTIEHLILPVFQYLDLSEALIKMISITLAFSFITFLHVVLGELAPKTLAIQKAEAVTLLTAKPLILFYKLMYPFIWVLNSSARLFIRLFGLHTANEHEIAHSEEELRIILSESYNKGKINLSEYKYVNNIFEFDERIAREIMIPRTEIFGVFKNQSLKDNIAIMLKEKYTRYPVFDVDKDHIIGLVNIKEVLSAYVEEQETTYDTLDPFIRKIIHVIETIPVYDLLIKMQKENIHMAVLMDEYGGTSGIVTVEDILEEIVGEIRDEFDTHEKPYIQKENDHYVIDGKVLITEINQLLNIELDHEDIDTIGGWILSDHFDVKEGDIIPFDSYQFKVLEMEEHQVKKIAIYKA